MKNKRAYTEIETDRTRLNGCLIFLAFVIIVGGIGFVLGGWPLVLKWLSR